MPRADVPSNILFFDGDCSICNKTVDFTLTFNRKQNIYFSSLQSDFAADFLVPYNLNPKLLESVVFYENGTIYTQSDAIFQVNRHLTGLRFRTFAFFQLFPRLIRDWFYGLIANNRHRFIQKGKYCRIPSLEEKARFLY